MNDARTRLIKTNDSQFYPESGEARIWREHLFLFSAGMFATPVTRIEPPRPFPSSLSGEPDVATVRRELSAAPILLTVGSDRLD